MKTLSYKSVRKVEIAEFDFREKMNWEDAKKACENVGPGWRLPTKEEMQEIYKCYFLNGIGNFSKEDKYWLFEHNTLCWFEEEFYYYAGYEFKTKFEKTFSESFQNINRNMYLNLLTLYLELQEILPDKEKQRTANTGFASSGVTCKLGALCPPQADSVQVDSFVLRNPPERIAAKR